LHPGYFVQGRRRPTPPLPVVSGFDFVEAIEIADAQSFRASIIAWVLGVTRRRRSPQGVREH
jgi:hypothetical protein